MVAVMPTVLMAWGFGRGIVGALAFVLIAAMGSILYASAVLIPQFSQQQLGYTALLSGLVLGAQGGDRVGAKRLVDLAADRGEVDVEGAPTDAELLAGLREFTA